MHCNRKTLTILSRAQRFASLANCRFAHPACRLLVISAFLATALSGPFGSDELHRFAGPAPCEAADPKPDETPVDAAAAKKGWKNLFDGKSLKGWKIADFAGHGDVEVKGGKLVFGVGIDLTGATLTRKFPTMNYEVSLDAMKVDGSDFFCGLTFPVGDSPCTFIAGGWAGTVVGLSSIDGFDASENETTQFMNFEKGRWYRIRVRVTDEKIETWIDDKQIVDFETKNRKLSIRFEVEPNQPFGLAAYQTTSALKNIKYRMLKPAAEKQK